MKGHAQQTTLAALPLPLRVAALPMYAGLAALAAATALLSRALAAAGCPPDGYVDGAKLREAMTVIDHMSYREEQYRLQLRAARDEADARAREKRRAAAKLLKARAEADAAAREAAAARETAAVAAANAVMGGGGEDGGVHSGGAAARPAAVWPTHAAVVAALASSWWFRAQPDFPSISHKVVAALAVPLAVFWLVWLLARPVLHVGARSLLAGGAFLLGFCASSWVSLGAV